MTRSIEQILLIGLLLSTFCLLGCKDGQTITSGFVIPEATFATDDSAGASDHFVTLETSMSDVGTIVLDVVIHDVSEMVSGIALKLTYPAEFSRFMACTNGTLFPEGTCFAAETEVGSGLVFIGRSGSVGEFTPVSGGLAIVRLEFLVFGVGQGPIVFEGQNLGGGDASAVLDDNGDPIFMRWFSGTLIGFDPEN